MQKNLQSEKSLIGSILIEQECVDLVAGYVPDGNYFTNKLFGQAYDTALRLHAEGKTVDISTMTDAAGFDNYKMLELMGAVDETPTASHAEEYAKLIRENHIRKQLAELRKINPMDKKTFPTINSIFAETERILTGAGSLTINKDVPMEKLVENSLTSYVKEEGKENPNIISTGFYDLDKYIDGFEKGETIILAARPSLGKTALALCFTLNVAKQGRPVLFFSLEMRKERLVNRLICAESKVSFTEFKRRKLGKEEKDRAAEGAVVLSRLPIIINDIVKTTTEIKAEVARKSARQELGLVVIDFLTLLNDSQEKSQNTHSYVGGLVKKIQSMGHTYNVPILVLAQLNRAVAGRQNKRPVMSDLRESGNIEEAADKILFIHRDDYYTGESGENVSAEVGIAKNRDGMKGVCELLWIPQYTRFENMAIGHEVDEKPPWD